MSSSEDYEWYVLPPKNDDGSFKKVAGRIGWLVMYSDGTFKNLVTGQSGNIIGSGGSGTSLDVLDDGTEIVADATDLDFAGGYFDVTNPTSALANVTPDESAWSHNNLSGISKGDHRTDEQIRDLVAAFVTAGAAISATHDDGNDTLQIAVPSNAIDATQIDESAAFAWTGSHDFTGGDIEVPDPTQNAEAATKKYVDATSQGLQGKDAVVVATDGTNIDLTSTTDPNPIDGVTLLNGERILLKDQTDGTENGIYEAVDAGDPSTWVRSSDMDEDSEVEPGVYVFVEAGTANGDTGWFITNDSVTLGTTDITWSIFARAGEISAGDHMTKTGSTLDVEPQTIDPNALNNVTVTAMLEGADADKPSAGTAGRWYHATDTKIVYRDNGTSWVAQGGKGTSSNPVPGTSHYEAVSTDDLTVNNASAVLEKTTNQSIAQSTDETIDWDSQDVDTNLYTYDGASDDIDVLQAGDYSIVGALQLTGVASGDKNQPKVTLNGSAVRRPNFFAAASVVSSPIVATLKDLSVNDTISFDAFTDSSSGATVSGDAKATYVTISKIA